MLEASPKERVPILLFMEVKLETKLEIGKFKNNHKTMIIAEMSCFLQPFDSSIHLPNLFFGPKGINTFWLFFQNPTSFHLAIHTPHNKSTIIKTFFHHNEISLRKLYKGRNYKQPI
jgi:hypothetical protein